MTKLMNALSIAVVSSLFVSSAFGTTHYIVGNEDGWSDSVDYYYWVKGKTFYVNDVLVFNYNKGDHNVILSSKEGYDNCDKNSNYGVYDTGKDSFSLTNPGDVYFFCEYHCDFSNQKLHITVNPSP